MLLEMSSRKMEDLCPIRADRRVVIIRDVLPTRPISFPGAVRRFPLASE